MTESAGRRCGVALEGEGEAQGMLGRTHVAEAADLRTPATLNLSTALYHITEHTHTHTHTTHSQAVTIHTPDALYLSTALYHSTHTPFSGWHHTHTHCPPSLI